MPLAMVADDCLRDDLPRRTEKPWGYELLWALTATYAAKFLYIRSGHALSLQLHVVKDETIRLETGSIVLYLMKDGVEAEYTLHPGDSFRIPPGTVHRMTALEDSCVAEVSTPELDDVVRLEDRYGRMLALVTPEVDDPAR